MLLLSWLEELWKNGNKAIGYFLSSGPMSGSEMKTLLLECITKLNSIGLKVIVVIGDQGANTRNLFEKQLGITIANPFFMEDSEKIFAMYDPPHLVKNVRNNLKKTWIYH